MSPRDARKLLGGYATGTLTPEEAKALLEAALEDQELFEAIVREQPVRDVLADPIARGELIRALDEGPVGVRARWWRRWWIPAGAAAAATACAVVAFIVLPIHRTTNVPVQVARSVPTVESAPVPSTDTEVPPAASVRKPRQLKTSDRTEPASAPPASPAAVEPQVATAARDELARADLQNEPNRTAPLVVRGLAPMAATVSHAPSPSDAGVRYTMVKGSQVVQPSSVFRPGDEVEIFAETPSNDYLYAFRKDDNGAWTPILAGVQTSARKPLALPPLRIESGATRVEIMLIATKAPAPGLDPNQVRGGAGRRAATAASFAATDSPAPLVVRIPLTVTPGKQPGAPAQ